MMGEWSTILTQVAKDVFGAWRFDVSISNPEIQKSLKQEQGRCIDFMSIPKDSGVRLCENFPDFSGKFPTRKSIAGKNQTKIFNRIFWNAAFFGIIRKKEYGSILTRYRSGYPRKGLLPYSRFFDVNTLENYLLSCRVHIGEHFDSLRPYSSPGMFRYPGNYSWK